jgi:hypothetical protein
VNWFPATYTGSLQFEQRGPDGDLNIHLNAPSPNGSTSPVDSILTQANVSNSELHGTIELEFNDEETIYRFETPWWRKFTDYVDAEGVTVTNPDGTVVRKDPALLIDNTLAVVTGLASVDNEHGAHAELHPVYAIAIKVQDPQAPNTETWPFFARNWGNQGECSSAIHFLDLPDNTYTFRLPWDGADPKIQPDVTAEYGYGFGSDNRKFTIRPESSADNGLLISLQLPKSPDAGGTLEGVLTVKWASLRAPAGAPPKLFAARLAVPLPAVKAPKKAEGAEDVLTGIYQTLSPADQSAYRQALRKFYLATSPAADAADAKSRKSDMDRRRVGLMIEALGGRIQNLDKKKVAFLCGAMGGTIPSQPALCKPK